MGHDCEFKNSKNHFYISYNHSIFSHIWHISRAHGHRGETIAKDILKALSHEVIRNVSMWNPDEEKDKPHEERKDCWTDDLSVFKYLLHRLMNICISNNMDNRLYSDCLHNKDIIRVEDSDGESDTDDNL
jgi:hypothetical protein